MKINEILKKMSLDEKCAQLTCIEALNLVDENGKFDAAKAEELLEFGIGGISSSTNCLFNLSVDYLAQLVNDLQEWLKNKTGIPALVHTETMSGFACPGAPIYPDPICLASTFDQTLAGEMGAQIRAQMLPAGVRHTLAPVLDLAWDLRWGRCGETMGEDHILTAAFGVEYVKGLQNNLSDGVVTTVKHFAGHGLVEGGKNCAPVHVGKRELADIHLYPFEAAVKVAGTQSLMNAYHVIDGVPCTSSRELMTGILREKWGFEGFISSDYWSIDMLVDRHATAADVTDAAVQALNAGIDLECPQNQCYGANLAKAVRAGKISEEIVDISVLRILKVKEKLGLLDVTTFADPIKALAIQNDENAINTTLEVARKGIVLLKNNGILPLKPTVKKVAVIGPFAKNLRNMIGHYSCFGLNFRRVELETEKQLADYMITPISLLFDSLKKAAPQVEFTYLEGCSVFGDNYDTSAIELAKNSDVVILALGDRSAMFEDGTIGENLDRADMMLFGRQKELANEIADVAGYKTVLTLFGGKPIILDGLENKVNAILMAWIPGMKGCEALAEIIIGKTNPSGKLPVTWARSLGQMPMRYNRQKGSDKKTHFVNHLDCQNGPLYAFGHGLSYTSFEYSDMVAKLNGKTYEISVTVKNAGEVQGDEVVQVYARDVVASIAPACMQLVAWKRVSLNIGQRQTINFSVPLELLAFTGIDKRLVTEAGEFIFMAGGASDDIRVQQSIVLEKSVFYEKRTEFVSKVKEETQ